MFIQETFIDMLSIDQQIQVSVTVSNLIMQIVKGITNIQVERNSNNLPAEDQILPVLLHDLVKLKGHDFMSIIVKYRPRLKKISKLELQHHELLLLYPYNSDLQSELNKCDHITSFESGWAVLGQLQVKKFTILRDFCGGIASVFPNTVTVESDFSILD